MTIRQMTIDDYEQLYDLWMSCKGMGLNTVDDTREGIAKFIERNPTTCLCALEKDKLVGAIMIGTDGRRGYIYHTAVAPDCQRKGIGGALVAAGMTETAKLGISKVALVVFNRNETGNAFWEKQGFTVRTDITYRNKLITDMVRIDT